MLADKEQRSLKRWEINCTAKIRLRYNNVIKNFPCVIKNINFKGFHVYLTKELPGLKEPKLTLVFPNNDSFTAKVKIAWKKSLPEGVLYGFNIISMKDKERNIIFRFINQQHFPDLLKIWWQDAK